MNKKYNYRIITLFLLAFAASTASEPIVALDTGEFKDLPEERRLKVRDIEKEFDDVSNIMLNKNKKNYIRLAFPSVREKAGPQSKNLETFSKSVRAIKMDRADSTSMKKAIETWEKNGRLLIEKVGYPNRKGFSLKIDTFDLLWRYPLSEKGNFNNGSLTFHEYYNGIKIESYGIRISFDEDRIDKITLETFADDDISIPASEPKIPYHEALKKYLSSSKITKQVRRPKGGLCFRVAGNKSFKLCWKIDFDAGSLSRIVYINALSGQVEEERSTVKNAGWISGTVLGYKYPTGNGDNQTPSQTGIPAIEMTLDDGFSDLATTSTSSSGGYKFLNLTEEDDYGVTARLYNSNNLFHVFVGAAANSPKDAEDYDVFTATDDKANFTWEQNQTQPNVHFWWPVVHDWYVSNWGSSFIKDWTAPDGRGKVMQIFTEAASDNADRGSYIELTSNGGKYPTALFHEYTHIMVEYKWGDVFTRSFYAETNSMEEGVADYMACKCANQTGMFGLNNNRNLWNNGKDYSIVEPITSSDIHGPSQVLSGALFDATDRIGWDNMKQLVWDAGKDMVGDYTSNWTFSNFFTELLIRDYKKFGSAARANQEDPTRGGCPPHGKILCEVFCHQHGISPGKPIPKPETYCEDCINGKWAAPMLAIDKISGNRHKSK